VAAYVATAYPNKISRFSGVKTFALNGVELFHQRQQFSGV